MKKDSPKLSPLEWEIMEIIWRQPAKAVSVREVITAAYPNGEKAYTTVQTVMNNLILKGYLVKEKIGLVNFYKPLKKRHDQLKKETSRFVDKVFGGSFLNLADYLIGSKSLSAEEIADLKKIIDQYEKGEN